MNLLIATPNNGHVCTGYMESILDLTRYILDNSVGSYEFKSFEFSDIVFSRNYLMSYFVCNQRFSHMLFVDSDMVWRPDQFMRLLNFDADFVCAHCPDRRPDWNVASKIMSNLPLERIREVDLEQTISESQRYVTVYKVPNGMPFSNKEKDGFETVAGIGMAFALIKRSVPEAMVKKGIARNLPRMASRRLFQDLSECFDFFSHIITYDGAMLGEDQSFCYRWIAECSGEVWADRSSCVDHVGRYTFKGDYFNSAQRRRRDGLVLG